MPPGGHVNGGLGLCDGLGVLNVISKCGGEIGLCGLDVPVTRLATVPAVDESGLGRRKEGTSFRRPSGERGWCLCPTGIVDIGSLAEGLDILVVQNDDDGVLIAVDAIILERLEELLDLALVRWLWIDAISKVEVRKPDADETSECLGALGLKVLSLRLSCGEGTDPLLRINRGSGGVCAMRVFVRTAAFIWSSISMISSPSTGL